MIDELSLILLVLLVLLSKIWTNERVEVGLSSILFFFKLDA